MNEMTTGTTAEAEPLSEPVPTLPSRPVSTATTALVTLAILAVFYTLWVAADVLVPFLLAFVLKLLLQPALRLLCGRLKIPTKLAAALLVIATFALISGVAASLAVPATAWFAKAPQGLSVLQERLSILREPVQMIRDGVDRLEHLTDQPAEPGKKGPVAVQQASNLGSVGLDILMGTQHFVGRMFMLVVVLFFLLAAGDSFLRRLVEVIPGFHEKKYVVLISNQVERNVSGYLATITVVNVMVGIAAGTAMYACGLPDPLLWATMAFLLNYLPILGAMIGVSVIFVVGLLNSQTIADATLQAGIYWGIHLIESQLITPTLLARRFTLNPLFVILSFFFWDWLWGVPGAFLSMPLLAIFKIVCDRIPSLTPIGHMLEASGKRSS